VIACSFNEHAIISLSAGVSVMQVRSERRVGFCVIDGVCVEQILNWLSA
jgi:hypothetical protein